MKKLIINSTHIRNHLRKHMTVFSKNGHLCGGVCAYYRITLLSAALLFLSSASAYALPGDLDPEFGDNGIVLDSFGNSLSGGRNSMVKLPDDSIVVLSRNKSPEGFALVKFTAQGTVDTTFGTNGKVVTTFTENNLNGFDPNAIYRQSDGKLVAAGKGLFSSCGFICSFSNYFLLARYNPDGSLDSTFGIGGKSLVPRGSLDAGIFALAEQPDHKLVAVGKSNNTFAVARFHPDGALDQKQFGPLGEVIYPGFGPDGSGVIQINGLSPANDVAVLDNDKILVSAGPVSVLRQFNSDGSVDTTFGDNGMIVLNNSPNFGIDSFAVQSDGSIIASGYTIVPEPAKPDFAVMKFSANGLRDMTFGTNGIGIADFGDLDEATDLVMESTGKIIVTGYTLASPTPPAVAIARFNSNGTLDNTFGTDGKMTTVIGGGGISSWAATEVSGNKLVIGGTSSSNINNEITDYIALARYVLAAQPANSPPTAAVDSPYTVVENSSVTVTATGNDPDGDELNYAWDLDNDGSFETPGQSATFSAAGLSVPSSHTIAVQATDTGGLTATAQATVNVIYAFSGFFSPVDNVDGNGHFILNSVKAGTLIPIRFSLSGDHGLDILASGYPRSETIDCDPQATVDGIEETLTAGPNTLTYDASTDQYLYKWKTNKTWAGGCRQLVLKLNDTTVHRASFTFR